jgi:hypothetical protein
MSMPPSRPSSIPGIDAVRWPALLAFMVCSTGCVVFPPLTAVEFDGLGSQGQNPDWTVYQIASPEIRESSGLVKSRQYDLFWTHNDSGDRPRIFAITRAGELIAEYEVAGAGQVDWEDIATDDAGNLYVGDIGNNLNNRRDLGIYRITEPDPSKGGGVIEAERFIAYQYADQESFNTLCRWNFDAEALFWMDGALVVATKDRSDHRFRVYRISDGGSDEGQPERVDPWHVFDLGGTTSWWGNVTGADLSSDGRWLALLTYSAVLIYERTPDRTAPFQPSYWIDLRLRETGQVEAIAWDGDALIFGNESGRLYSVAEPRSRRIPPPRR